VAAYGGLEVVEREPRVARPAHLAAGTQVRVHDLGCRAANEAAGHLKLLWRDGREGVVAQSRAILVVVVAAGVAGACRACTRKLGWVHKG
jgi:hypothetical protein